MALNAKPIRLVGATVYEVALAAAPSTKYVLPIVLIETVSSKSDAGLLL